MKRLRLFSVIAVVVLAVGLVAAVTAAHAQTGGGYNLTWSTVDGGGTSTGGDYTLSGTAGQPDAGTMTGGDFALGGGFWTGLAETLYDVFVPLILR